MNQQDPLVQLQDIHLPAEIGLWPLAWGWWILIAILLSTITLLIFFTVRHKSRNAYRAIALAELTHAFNKYDQEKNAEYLQALSIILRRTALSGFGQHFNASLKNDAWLQWLDAQSEKTKHEFSQGIGRVLLIGPYQKQPSIDRHALQRLAIVWIKEHRNQWQQKIIAQKKMEAA